MDCTAVGSLSWCLSPSFNTVRCDNLLKQRDRQSPRPGSILRYWTGCCNSELCLSSIEVSLSILCTDSVEPVRMEKMKRKSSALMMDTGQCVRLVSLMVTTDGANCLPTDQGFTCQRFIFRIITPWADGGINYDLHRDQYSH